MRNRISAALIALIALIVLMLSAMTACSCSGGAEEEFSLDMTVSDSDAGTTSTTYQTNPSDDGFGTPVPM